jgi:putative ABC transport system substrate-binding protein
MRRREFVGLFCSATAIWPLAARGQQPAIPIIGFLNGASAGPWKNFVAAFRNGLRETGYIEGQNVGIEYRWADGRYDRLPELANDLVRRKVDVIAATGGIISARAAEAATATIPIVFSVGDDPVKLGLVASLNRPGRNATGVALFVSELGAKKLGLLRELVPTVGLIAVLLNSNSPASKNELNDIEQAAHDLQQDIHILWASNERELDVAFETMTKLRAGALIVAADPFLNSHRDQIIALVARQRIAAIYEGRDFAVAGGLMSYGTNFAEAYRQVGLYTGRILKGDKPANLPVVQSTKFEFVINLKTAKLLNLNVPPTLLAEADEVVE